MKKTKLKKIPNLYLPSFYLGRPEIPPGLLARLNPRLLDGIRPAVEPLKMQPDTGVKTSA